MPPRPEALRAGEFGSTRAVSLRGPIAGSATRPTSAGPPAGVLSGRGRAGTRPRRPDPEKPMRTTLLLPATCLALLAAPAAAQQAAPAPQPGPAETAPAPAPEQRTGMPHEMGREMGRGMHAHRGMFQAPGLRIRFGGVFLDPRCAGGGTSEGFAPNGAR